MCHVTSALTNQRRVFKAYLTQTEQVSDDVTCKIGPLDFIFKALSSLCLPNSPGPKFLPCPTSLPEMGLWG